MKTTLCTWEDETCNRQVQFSIAYTIENRAVRINRVTPQKISFVCPETNAVSRVIAVHTDRGRRLLADRFLASQARTQLERAIGSPNANVSLPHMGIRMEICGTG